MFVTALILLPRDSNCSTTRTNCSLLSMISLSSQCVCHVTDGGQCWANSDDRVTTHVPVPRPPSSSSRQRSSKHRIGLAHSLSSSASSSVTAVSHLSLDILC